MNVGTKADRAHGASLVVLVLLMYYTLCADSFQPPIRTAAWGSPPFPFERTSVRRSDSQDSGETVDVNGGDADMASARRFVGGNQSRPKQERDSLLQFSLDVKHVLHNLRNLEYDPFVPKHLIGRKDSLSYSRTWTLSDWEYHNSRKRYIRYIIKFPFKSRLIRRTFPLLSALWVWTFVYFWVGTAFPSLAGIQKPQIPLSSLGTISTFVAFLLTLRSNQALARLNEARKLWSMVILDTREMASLISSFIYPVDEQLALMLCRHVAIFGWLLKSQLRFVKKEEVVDIVRTMLPNKADADYVLSQRQKTVAVVTRIRQVIAHLGKQHKLTTAEELALDHTAHALDKVITSTGRIRAVPIPTLYTSHTSRLLIFYLLCLPPALHMSGLDGVTTTLLTTVVGFAMAERLTD